MLSRVVRGARRRQNRSGPVPRAVRPVFRRATRRARDEGPTALGHPRPTPVGATFHVAHGRTDAILLPHVIRYNGTVPAELTGWPEYESHRAPERFQDIARALGLPASNAAEGVASYAAVEHLRDPRMPMPADMEDIMRTASYAGPRPLSSI
nr:MULTISPECIES: iron-containing alcohol dehydrogenase [unclassified Streptomyces]